MEADFMLYLKEESNEKIYCLFNFCAVAWDIFTW